MGSDTLQQPSVSQPLRTCRERVGGAPPLELVHVPEQGRVGPQRRQLLEQQRPVAAVPQHRRGKILQSEILVADSLHTASDILSSLSVLIGLAAVSAGYPLLDPIAGVAIAGFIGRTGLLVLREATQSLADRARLDADAIRLVALTVEGVRCCDEIRTRGLPRHVFMDLCIHVDSAMTIACAHTVAHNVEDRLKQAFPGVAEVVVHVEPEDHG